MFVLSIVLAWLLTAAASALGIVMDMRRLGTARVGVSANAWVGLALVAGPISLLAYLLKRRVVRQELIDGVWRLVGDSSHPLTVRYARLEALYRLEVVGPSIYFFCRRELRQEVFITRSKEENTK
ncbi:MAG: hypothetical protein AB7P11_15360 [Hydrogenophaga sp.]|uniref:hypothetical protein n=1 Tax=Hydrogenophaga sp. TaxID=1904254 RepID=UPI003D0F0CE5